MLDTTTLSYVVPTSLGRYRFSVYADAFGSISVGEVTRENTPYPERVYPLSVQSAINSAVSHLENIVAGNSNLSGSITLTNASEGNIIFPSVLQNINFRVVFSIDDFILARIKSRSTTGFSFELSTNFTGIVRYDVFI